MGKKKRNPRWRKSNKRQPAPSPSARWFPIALVTLPCAAFTAVLLAPSFGETPQAMAADSSSNGSAGRSGVARARASDTERAFFTRCSGPTRVTCVVDGDTIWYRGEKIRLVGFDTPEISNPGCPREARLGAEATSALQDWLNQGAFTLSPNPDGRSQDRYGRSLRVLSRGGVNVGEMLLGAGLAERRGGRRNVWC